MIDRGMAEIIGKLAAYFPAQSTPERSNLYLKDLGRAGLKLEDVREGVERVIASREQATFPPYAVVIRCCIEARTDRVRRERDREGGDEQRRLLTSEESARAVASNRALRETLGLVVGAVDMDNPFKLKKRLIDAESAELHRLAAEREKRFGTSADEVPF